MILKHRDREILRFEWIEPQGVRSFSVNESTCRFLLGDRLRAIEDFLKKRILQIEQLRDKNDVFLQATSKSGTVNPLNSEKWHCKIIANLKVDPFVSYDELSEILGIPRRTVTRRMKELSVSGAITRKDTAKNGYWAVSKDWESTIPSMG